jgi:hypothetical protein
MMMRLKDLTGSKMVAEQHKAYGECDVNNVPHPFNKHPFGFSKTLDIFSLLSSQFFRPIHILKF